MRNPILVIGGAGYIGSHMVKCLYQHSHEVVVLDDLSSGRREAIGKAVLVEGNVGDRALLDTLFTTYNFSGVMHFASFIQVGESVQHPGKYYDNNLVRTLTLLNAMRDHKIQHFIFSSSAAVFGNPHYTPIDEAHPRLPINPYGKSKHMVEEILADYAHAYGLRYAALRYFNAAGADPEGELGECHEPETHLIPLILQAASGRRKEITIFGTDYDTPDGTCVRDYIHIMDLAEAHLSALQYLLGGGKSGCFNLGTGRGYSIREVIDMARLVTGVNITVHEASRREGDPAILVADGAEARRLFQWQPRLSDLTTLLTHAWAWEQKFRRV